MKSVTFTMLSAVGFLAAAQTASAAIITSVDRATFQASIAEPGINLQDFDGFSSGDILGTEGGITYGSTGGAAIVTSSVPTTTSPNSLGSTAFGNFFSVFELATFIFDTPITAFAIDINPVNGDVPVIDGAYSADIDVTSAADSVFQIFPGGFEGQFLGFISDTPFTNVSIGAIADSDFTLDTLVFGDASALVSDPGSPTDVSEPGALLLLSGGLLGIIWARRRRNTQKTTLEG